MTTTDPLAEHVTRVPADPATWSGHTATRTEVDRDQHNGRIRVIVRDEPQAGQVTIHWLSAADAVALAEQLAAVTR